MSRIFVALDPPAIAAEQCLVMQQALKQALPHLRLVPVQNMHMTLVFLGDLNPDQIEAMKTAVTTVPVTDMDWRLTRVRVFSNTALVAEALTTEAANTLKTELEGAAERAGISLPDREKLERPRPLQPHITLARSKTIVRPEDIPTIEAPEPISWRMQSLTLYRSNLSESGAEYEPIVSRTL